MKLHSQILCLVLTSMVSLSARSNTSETRQHFLVDNNWKFIQSDIKDAEKPGFNDSNWRTLNLPHDWSIEGEFKEDAATKGNGGYLPTGIGWYRKIISVPGDMKEKEVWIEFDGVYMNSDVWINGHLLGRHPYGYTGFSYNLTPFIKKGKTYWL
jgi:beta-galactosidase